MAEPYVDHVIDAVAKVVPYHEQGAFWIWLGGVRYREANGTLTPELATEIRKDALSLYAEWQASKEAEEI